MYDATPITPQDKLPDIQVYMKVEDDIDGISLAEWAESRKVVLFAVPGAFTPTCAVRHLPEYVNDLEALKAKGVDAVGCLAVNDVFVMHAWAEASQATGIDMFADPLGDAAKALGIYTLNAPPLGNTRAARMALIADDGVVSHIFIEEDGAYEVSSSAHIMKHL
jgi:peroxiredoxin